jgi:hypothetical protein
MNAVQQKKRGNEKAVVTQFSHQKQIASSSQKKCEKEVKLCSQRVSLLCVNVYPPRSRTVQQHSTVDLLAAKKLLHLLQQFPISTECSSGHVSVLGSFYVGVG